MKAIIIVYLLLFTVSNFAQDLIYKDNKSIVKCRIDTASLKTDIVTYARYDQEGKFQLPKNKILYIKNFNGDIIYPKDVIGVESSKHLHWTNVSHYNKDDKIARFSSIKAGLDAGYSLCTACFDYSVPLPDQKIEWMLTQQALYEVRINLEIIHDDKRLPHLKEVLNKVLKNWPEKKKGYEYSIQIYKGEPNAFAISGGYVFVSTSLLDLLESDGELESVLAHEITHVEKRHQLRQWNEIQRQKNIGGFLGFIFATIAVVSGEGKYAKDIIELTNTITDFVISIRKNGYSRDLEEEADILAQLYFQKNGRPLNDMKLAFAKIIDYDWIRGGDIRESGGDHPSPLERLNQIEKSETTLFGQPIKVECKEIAVNDNSKVIPLQRDHFFNLEIGMMNNMPSSNDNKSANVILLGEFINTGNENTYKINSLNLISKQNSIDLALAGCEDLVIAPYSTKEIMLKTVIDNSKIKDLKSVLNTKNDLIFQIELERVDVNKKGGGSSYVYRRVPILTRVN